MADTALISKYIVGLYGAAPGGFLPILTEFVDAGTSERDMALLLAADASFTGLDANYADTATDADFVATFVENLVGDSMTAAQKTSVNALLLSFLDGTNGSFTRPELVVAAIDALDAIANDDPDYGTAATYFDDKVAAAVAYTGTETDVPTLQAVIAAVELPAGEFSLESGLADLSAANDALADFLFDYAQDPDVEGDEAPALESDITDAFDAAVLAVDGFIEAYTSATSVYDSASTAVQTALVSDTEAALASDLADADAALADAQADVDAVTGLSAAIAALDAADDAEDAALLAADQADIDETAAEATFDLNNGTVTFGEDGVSVDGTLVIAYDADADEFSLATGIDAADYPTVTAYIDALNATIAAWNAYDDAVDAADAAQIVVDDLDLDATAEDSLAAVQLEMGLEEAPLRAEMDAELTIRKALLDTEAGAAETGGATVVLTYAADGSVTAYTIDGTDQTTGGVSAAYDDYDALWTAVDTYKTDASATTPLTDALAAAQVDADAAQDAVDDFADLVADQADAQADVDVLEGLQDAVTAAEDAFADAGLETPVTLDGTPVVASADDDIFVYNGEAADSVALFGLLGTDTLFVGNDYTYNAGDIDTDGDNAVLEFFLVENGADLEITLETEVFGSNSTDAENVITLTGVAIADVVVDGGFITNA